LVKKIIFFSWNFFSIFGQKTLYPDWIWIGIPPQTLDPDPDPVAVFQGLQRYHIQHALFVAPLQSGKLDPDPDRITMDPRLAIGQR
jgi:hypothetical protein